MPALSRPWSRAEVLALPTDSNRYELVDGELLVTPSPRRVHQIAVFEMARILDNYVRAHRIGFANLSPADLDLRAGQLLQPDFFVSAPVGGRRGREWSEIGIPLLVGEVMSPSSARYDKVTKRLRYQRSGVPTYWLVDLDGRVVEVWTPGDDRPAIIADILSWRPDPSAAPLEIDLSAFFTEILDA
jgi:Uma2 family endonuclease